MSRYTSISTISPARFATANRDMSAEQLDQIVTAIVEGKYSWACVLILRCAGYNPADYMPYRTYKRLVKENRTQPANAQNG
ncbi:HetP family heterocyst commitment protein [Leptolyngbya sp. KIOST-1]|uniref:HetP family heterocyst commitment protein n=1 Tax=Leptolyngbya sp. KIOST-1 TaxID=1229172 RepID=UPI000A5E3B67|nr:HetP family heterocyst commitment protein [Leptolyngbya sp. KIOST-1]